MICLEPGQLWTNPDQTSKLDRWRKIIYAEDRIQYEYEGADGYNGRSTIYSDQFEAWIERTQAEMEWKFDLRLAFLEWG